MSLHHHRLFFKRNSYKSSLLFDLGFAIISIGIIPDLFEGLAIRGTMMNQLLGTTGTWSVIRISSPAFTLLNLSIASLIWMLPFSILLGYNRIRFNTLVYLVLIHLVHNTSIVLIDYYEWTYP